MLRLDTFPLPTHLLSLVYSTLRKLIMLSITASRPPLDLMFPQELISPEVSKQLPPELTVRQLHRHSAASDHPHRFARSRPQTTNAVTSMSSPCSPSSVTPVRPPG